MDAEGERDGNPVDAISAHLIRRKRRTMNASKWLAFAGIVVTVATASTYGVAWTWTDLMYPAAMDTHASDISDGNIIGSYSMWTDGPHGFLYNVTSHAWTTLDYPGGTAGTFSTVQGISGNTVVGTHTNTSGGNFHGSVYSITSNTWTSLDYPGALNTWASGIDGNNIVGSYTSSSHWRGFLYNGTSWTNLDYPGAMETDVYGISNNNIVGVYRDNGNGPHGFLYNGVTWTRLDYPGAGDTYAYGVSGDNIVGYCATPAKHGFIYNISTKTWTTLDYPGTTSGTTAFGIDGNGIVGVWNSSYRSFLLTIPEPATLSLSALGGLMILRRRHD
jgi:hypothetical protein